MNGRPVMREISRVTFSSKPRRVLRPVPTAVPPIGKWLRRGSVLRTRSRPNASCKGKKTNKSTRERSSGEREREREREREE